MRTALICVRGYRVPTVLEAAATILVPDLAWLILHVLDSAPLDEVERALSGLVGRGPGHHHASDRLHQAATEQALDVQAEVATWLSAAGRSAELVSRPGRPELEILRLAEERDAHLIALGDDATATPDRLSPVVRHVVDHARCHVLLLRPVQAERDGGSPPA
jgi:nucleotide-binding universal stress UspA family protein